VGLVYLHNCLGDNFCIDVYIACPHNIESTDSIIGTSTIYNWR